MHLISHRGNTRGPLVDEENRPGYIVATINKGFQVEVDLWLIKDEWFLGHDFPQCNVKEAWLVNHKKSLWLHCKNLAAMNELCAWEHSQQLNFFWHQNDDFALTSKGYIWTYPNRPVTEHSVLVHPELIGQVDPNVAGICSDHIERFDWS